jgi:hypothetical protein
MNRDTDRPNLSTIFEVTLNTDLQVFSLHLKRPWLIVWQRNVPHLGQ